MAGTRAADGVVVVIGYLQGRAETPEAGPIRSPSMKRETQAKTAATVTPGHHSPSTPARLKRSRAPIPRYASVSGFGGASSTDHSVPRVHYVSEGGSAALTAGAAAGRCGDRRVRLGPALAGARAVAAGFWGEQRGDELAEARWPARRWAVCRPPDCRCPVPIDFARPRPLKCGEESSMAGRRSSGARFA